ncbi:MAG: Holliday junction branch migration protein RuvA [Desulfitobacteriia bacterium]|jgi:Holliday junction DNA helicase RuvA
MIGMLKGTIWTADKDGVVLGVNGVGFLLNVTADCLMKVRPGEEKTFYTHLQIRADDLSLYGFLHKEERELFLQFLNVSGIGPKAALALLSTLKVEQIRTAILEEDVSQLTVAPGVGPKTAKRIILELREKMKDFILAGGGEDQELSGNTGAAPGALETLLEFGFSRAEARDALGAAAEKGITNVEDQVKEALRFLALPK